MSLLRASAASNARMKRLLEQQASWQARQPGTLFISDDFRPGPGLPALHGDLVDAAARPGLEGTAVHHAQPMTALDDRLLEDRRLECTADLDPRVFRAALADHLRNSQTTLLRTATAENRHLLRLGANHAAVNFSQDASKAEIFDEVYSCLRGAWQGQQDGRHLLHNFARAYRLDERNRARVQRKLIELVNQEVGSPAKPAYDRSCQALAERRVSPVVAAGNYGDLGAMLEFDSGQAPALPRDFYDNPLSNRYTLTVGATGEHHHPDPTHVSSYSSRSGNVSVYADGEEGEHQGTSFAAPRVAAALANLHRRHPEQDNARIQADLPTRPLEGGGRVFLPNRPR